MKRAFRMNPQFGAGQASAFPLVAPLGGWNTVDPEASMDAKYALTLDNWYPDAGMMRPRGGSLSYTTGLTQRVRRLYPYYGASEKLFAFTDTGIFSVVSGAVGSSLMTLTKGEGSYTQHGTVAGQFGLFVNGTDSLKLFDGTTWESITSSSTPAITGLATTSLSFVCSHKSRLWFAEKGSLSAWYLPAGQIAGALTEFPLQPYFSEGGSLHSMATWTLDGGNGPDDYFVFVSTKGQAVIYRGTDPASSDTWALVGTFQVGEPLGTQGPVKLGADLLILSQFGLFPLSRLLTNSIVQRDNALSKKINTKLAEVGKRYASNFGWWVQIYAAGNCLLLTVPVTAEGDVHHYAYNLVTKAWARFTGWDSRCLVEFSRTLYGGTQDSVEQLLTGTSDNGKAIVCVCQQAYSTLGLSSRGKQITQLRPHLRVDDGVVLKIGAYADFRVNTPLSEISLFQEGSRFDEVVFDEGVFAEGFENKLPWLVVTSEPAYRHSLYVAVDASLGSVEWAATEILWIPASIFV